MSEGLLDLYIRYGVKKFSFVDYKSFSDALIDKYVGSGYLFKYEGKYNYDESDDGYYFFRITSKAIEYLKQNDS